MSSVKNPRLEDLRRWEELDPNILKNTVKLVSSRDLFWNISPVCRSWRFACWDTLFWSDPKTLDLTGFSDALELPDLFVVLSSEGMEKRMRILERLLGNIMAGNYDAYGLHVELWRQSISKIVIPEALLIPDELLLFIAERTPEVETVMLFELRMITMGGFARAMRYWKNLTHFAAGFRDPWDEYSELIEEIGRSCPKLTTLELHPGDFHYGTEVAQVIAKSLPNKLTTLRFENSKVYREGVDFVLNNCPQLKVIHFCKCHLMLRGLIHSLDSYTFECRSKSKGGEWEWYLHHGSRSTGYYSRWFGNLSRASGEVGRLQIPKI